MTHVCATPKGCTGMHLLLRLGPLRPKWTHHTQMQHTRTHWADTPPCTRPVRSRSGAKQLGVSWLSRRDRCLSGERLCTSACWPSGCKPSSKHDAQGLATHRGAFARRSHRQLLVGSRIYGVAFYLFGTKLEGSKSDHATHGPRTMHKAF